MNYFNEKTIVNQDNLKIVLANFKDFWSLFYFFTKKSLTSLYFYLILLLPIIVIVAIGSIISFDTSFINVLVVTVSCVTMLNYGFLYFSIKKSTLSSLIETKYNFFILKFSIFTSIFFINLIALTFIIALSAFLYTFQIIVTFGGISNVNFDTYQRIIVFDIFNSRWLINLYYIFFLIIITYLICVFIEAWINTPKQYFLFSISYIILNVFFGGTLSPDFPMSPLMSAPGTSNYLSSNGTYVIYPYPRSISFGFVWCFSQLFPVHNLNQFNYYAFTNMYLIQGSRLYYQVQLIGLIKNIPLNADILIKINYFSFTNWYWTYILITPYVWLIFFITFDFWRINKMQKI